jgi:hypothetical protein
MLIHSPRYGNITGMVICSGPESVAIGTYLMGLHAAHTLICLLAKCLGSKTRGV